MSIADEIVNGEICSFCMMPHDKEVGYPCLCAECYDPNDKEHNPLNPYLKEPSGVDR